MAYSMAVAAEQSRQNVERIARIRSIPPGRVAGNIAAGCLKENLKGGRLSGRPAVKRIEFSSKGSR
jgi:hypothetical protein